ncbi:MAG: IS3 family transposase, partial [Micavibrio sp.]|nr:IS3 family transposase [Micavibrio sp.]
MIKQPRSTQRREPVRREDEDALTEAIIRLASEYGRYGYRRITALLQAEGWDVNHKRVWRIWRREGLKVPMKQPKKGRLWLNDGSCIRLRPSWKNHVWAYDFMHDRTKDGRAFRMLTVIDEYSRECLAIVTKRKLKSGDVLEALGNLFVTRGLPDHIRSDNGAEFTAIAVREWLGKMEVKPTYIEPGSPWENGYNES